MTASRSPRVGSNWSLGRAALMTVALVTALPTAASSTAAIQETAIPEGETASVGLAATSDLRASDLLGWSSGECAALFAAAPPTELAELAVGTVTRHELLHGVLPQPLPGNLSVRGMDLGDGSSVGFLQLRLGRPIPFKSFSVPSMLDGRPSYRLNFDVSPNTDVVARRKEELRTINHALVLGATFGAVGVDVYGLPLTPPASTVRYFVLDLEATVPPPVEEVLGWPWNGPVPQGGAPPGGWSRSFAVDPESYPFESKVVTLRQGEYHYIDESPPDPRGTILFVHGNPTWSFLWRETALELYSRGFRVIAPDHFGFGFSSNVPKSTVRDHADTLVEFAQALGLEGLQLVLHDWGVPIGLYLAGVQPSRVDRLVVSNGWFWNLRVAEPGPYHLLVDWSILNLMSALDFLATGSFPFGVGNGLGELAGPVGSSEYDVVSSAYWGPFLDPQTMGTLSDNAILPTISLCQGILTETGFLAEVESLVSSIAHKPLGLLFGGRDAFFGALRVDSAPFDPCPGGWTPSSSGGAEYCVDANGDRAFPFVERWVDAWDSDSLVDVFLLPEVGHFSPEEAPAEFVELAQRVHAFAGAGCTARDPGPKLLATLPSVGEMATVRIEGALPLMPGAVYWAPGRATPSAFGGCVLFASLTTAQRLATFTTDAKGEWGVSFPVARSSAPIGLRAHFQALTLAPSGPLLGNYESSNALEVLVR